MANVRELLLPYLEELKRGRLDAGAELRSIFLRKTSTTSSAHSLIGFSRNTRDLPQGRFRSPTSSDRGNPVRRSPNTWESPEVPLTCTGTGFGEN